MLVAMNIHDEPTFWQLHSAAILVSPRASVDWVKKRVRGIASLRRCTLHVVGGGRRDRKEKGRVWALLVVPACGCHFTGDLRSKADCE